MPVERPLAYKDKWVWQIAEVVSESIDPDALATFPDQTTQVELTISLNQQEYTRILSALCVGAELAFPLKAQQIYYDFMKMTNGSIPVSCEDIADCLESELVAGNETLINEITNTINQNGFGNPNHVNPTLTTIPDRNLPGALDEPINPDFVCDLDKLWGGIREGIVQRMDDSARTVLENLAAINDVPERLQTLLDTVPVLGDLAEFFVTNLTQVIPDLKNLYEAHSSIENLDGIACDLFDLVCAECRYPTFNEVMNYYKSFGLASGTDIADLTLQIITDFVTGSAITAAEITYFTVQTWQLFVWYIQATFDQNSGTRTLLNYAVAGEDSDSNNWQDLCDGCNEAYAWKVWDYQQQQYNSYKTTGFSGLTGGTYVAGQGWRVDKVNATGVKITMAQPIDPSWKIRAIGYKTSIPRADIPVFNLEFRTISGSSTGATSVNLTLDASTNPRVRCRNGLLSITNFSEVAISLTDDPGSPFFLEKLWIVFDKGFAPSDAIPTSDITACEREV